MTARIQHLDNDIRARNQQLQEIMIQKQILESENNQIKRSATWKIVSFIHVKIVEKIFPPNTRRREKYNLGVKGVNVLINEGYYTFCTQVFQYISGIKYHRKVRHQSLTSSKNSEHESDISNNSDDLLTYTPKISIITPVYNVDEKYLVECIESVLQQTYKNWEFCLVDDASSKKSILEILKKYQNTDSRIKVRFHEKNLGISETTNAAIRIATGEFIAFLDNDDLLTRNALSEIVALLNKHSDADVIYSDQDKITPSGKYCEPFYKPDWSPEYFNGVMYIGHLLTVRKSIAEKVGLMDKTYDCIQDYEFMVRLSETTQKIYHIPKILYTWRKTEGSIAANSDSKGNISEKQVQAVNSHLKRLGLQAIALPGPFSHRVIITPLPRTHFPLVSIIIPTKDKPELIERCLKSIYELTSYPNFEVIIVDNNTTDKKALDIIHSYPVKKVDYTSPFNFSKINNFGATSSSGEYLIFLNNDTRIQSENWIESLLYYAEQPDIAAVGPLLIFPNNKVQHAGVVLGFRGTADHIMRDYPIDCDGYAGSLVCAREVSAVTAACMMVKKSVFLSVEGFNEHYSNIYQDVDLCLKLNSKGYRIIFNPRVMITHYECSTRDKKYYDLIDRNLLLDQWEEVINRGDKYYNCNFDLTVYGPGNTGYKEK
jgi:GT2 family glycosyltransferase